MWQQRLQVLLVHSQAVYQCDGGRACCCLCRCKAAHQAGGCRVQLLYSNRRRQYRQNKNNMPSAASPGESGHAAAKLLQGPAPVHDRGRQYRQTTNQHAFSSTG
jgi:hypothetical protein